MANVKPTYEDLDDFTVKATKLVKKYPEIFDHIEAEKIKCKAINNKSKPEKKGHWELKALPEYAIPDCPYAYYVIVHLSDWVELPEKIQNRLVADVLFAIPDEEGKVRAFDLRAWSPMIRAFGVDYMDDDKGEDPLADEVKWIL